MLTQEYINKVFQTNLGQQLDCLFSTPDDNVFIRKEEAIQHCNDNSLNEEEIIQWFEEIGPDWCEVDDESNISGSTNIDEYPIGGE